MGSRLQKKILLLMGAFIILIGLGSYTFWLSGQQYVPPEIVPLSNQFLNFLQKGDYFSAFEMTQKNWYIGADLEKFRKATDRELGPDPGRIDSISINYVFPKQTYGNRWRRQLRGQNPELDQISVDYSLSSNKYGGFALFEVRFKRTSENKWKISYFQAHAG